MKIKKNVFSIVLICSFEIFIHVASDENGQCNMEGFDCASNNNCCSTYCEKEPGKKLGTCKQACGRSFSMTINQTHSEVFPWHAAIYERRNDFYDQICGGTLISHTAVITAAPCLTAEEEKFYWEERKLTKKEITNLKVALGKYHRTFNSSEDTSAQTVDVKGVELSPDYKGFHECHFDDIAIITLKTSAEYTMTVRPVCTDFGPHSFEKDHLLKGVIGKTTGWAFTIASPISETLKLEELEFVPRGQCAADMHNKAHLEFVSRDKICATHEPSDGYGCGAITDIGTGLVFQHSTTKTYFIRGVFSKLPERWCYENKIRFFTKLSHHKELIENHLDDCKKVCRRSCGVYDSNAIQPAMETEFTAFPWHAGIYEYNATLGLYDHRCGGTLITRTIIISAAHCFVTDKQLTRRKLLMLKVAFGKQSRNLQTHEHLTQFVDVKSIEFDPQYKDLFVDDIAIVTLMSAVEYTRAVQPACVDVDPDDFEKDQLVTDAVGKIVGWDRIEQPKVNDTYMTDKVPFVTLNECKKDAGWLERDITKDVICVKDLFSDSPVCKNYDGAGLVFEDPKAKVYYLRGIGGLLSSLCASRDPSERYYRSKELFTRLSSYKELVRKHQDDCKRSCRPNVCEPLTSDKLHITCLNAQGQSIRCDLPLPTDSRMVFTCNSLSYMEIKRSKYNIINCRDGRWDRPLIDDFCAPAYAECGTPVSDSAEPAVFNGRPTKYGEFPWHAGIYEYNTELKSYEQICGGTLISHKVVISAAHCFENVIQSRQVHVKDLSTMKVSLGNRHRRFNSSEDFLMKIVEIQHVEIPSEYLSHLNQYVNDLAIVTLKTQVEYSRAIQPICIDVGPNNFENNQLTKGAVGKVVGWGLTTQNEPSETLILAEMPFVQRDECLQNIHSGLLAYIRNDKFCAGNKSSNVTVCKGDSGGGLVFQDAKTKKYYLRGIVSIGFGKCEKPDFALFTKLSSHVDLLEKYLRLF